MAVVHASRFVSVRKRYLVEFDEPSSATERSLQQKLNDAHASYFRRQFANALAKYKEIWWWIHTQARPNLPQIDHGSSLDVDITVRPDDFDAIAGRLKEILDAVGPEVRFPLGPRPGGPDPAPDGVLGIGSAAVTRTDFERRRAQIRPQLSDPASVEIAASGYLRLADEALNMGQERLAAETYTELGAALAASAQRLSPGTPTNRLRAGLREAMARSGLATAEESATAALGDAARDASNQALWEASAQASAIAARHYQNLGDDLGQGIALFNQAEALEALKQGAGKESRETARQLLPTTFKIDLGAGVEVPVHELLASDRPERRQSGRAVLWSGRNWELAVLPEERADLDRQNRIYNVYRHNYQVDQIAVDGDFVAKFKSTLYEARPNATTLDALDLHEEVLTNLVAFIPHLYFYVLPIAVGDCYVELGSYAKAIPEYAKAEIYPYLNYGIEAEFLWLKKASVYLRWGDFHFRQQEVGPARGCYETILTQEYEIPAASPLYGPSVYAGVRAAAGAVAQALRDGSGIPAGNPEIIALIGRTYKQLYKLNNGLNFLGLAADWYPVLRFQYLQSVARYMAEHAIQAERTYLNFLDSAERAEFQRLQLENALEVDTKSLEIESKRVEDANLERTIAGITRQHTELRHTHAQQAINDWQTTGRELASVNAALAWASNAANDQDITYTGVSYRGQSHDFDTDVEEFYDVVGEWREQLTYELQEARLIRERDALALEVAAAGVREVQAQTRVEIARLGQQLASIRRAGTRELLEFLDDRLLNEDVWYRLANAMRDVATDYLNMAIEAAYYMQRAYALEMDRDLNVIRFDYQLNDLNGLLAGDFLLRDIDRFTIDFLNNVRKRNPIRQIISLTDEHPYGFSQFRLTGRLPFRTELEYFDRRFPGTYGRKLRRVELFVEGLAPAEGVHGYLEQTGVSREWVLQPGGWQPATRVLASERLLLSSYQQRRDLTVFQPSQELLEVFENSGLETSWELVIPRSSNNIDYEAITDVKLVLYFDALYSPTLAAHVAGLYPNAGAAVLLISARFQFPDEYFAFDRTRSLTFRVHASRFPYNRTNLQLAGLSLRLLPRTGVAPEGHSFHVSRQSDNAVVDVTTDASGAVPDAPGGPFAGWSGGPAADTFVVTLASGGTIATDQIDDIQLGVRYAFTYRADA